MASFRLYLALLAASFLALPAMAQEGRRDPVAQTQTSPSTTVMQITVLDPHGNTDLYLSLVKKTIARQNVVAPGIRTRIFRGTLAGTSTGQLYLILEYRDMAFMVDALARLARDAEWDRLRRDVGIQTGRTLISDSLFADVTP